MEEEIILEIEKFLKTKTSFWRTLWRNFFAGLARGVGCVTMILILSLLTIFIFKFNQA